MNQYYLMAQLPSLDAVGENTPLPITEERFYELCNRLLGSRAAGVLNTIKLTPKCDEKPSGNALVDAWNKGESELRLALACVRAERMNKPLKNGIPPLPSRTVSAARCAAEMSDPMEAELYLNRFRLDFLETLRPADAFSQSAVYYYGLKLKLLSRIRGFDPDRGERQYRKIYDSIIHGKDQETIQ